MPVKTDIFMDLADFDCFSWGREDFPINDNDLLFDWGENDRQTVQLDSQKRFPDCSIN